MNNFTLQIIMTVLVWVNNLDCTEFRYWFEMPADVESYMSILKERIKLPVAEIKAEIWEDMFCAMSDRHISTDNEILKMIGKADKKINSATVIICAESMTHKGRLKRELLPENVDFEGWSPALHDIVEKATAELSNEIINILIAMADAYYNDSDGGGDPRYELRRNDQTIQTDA